MALSDWMRDHQAPGAGKQIAKHDLADYPCDCGKAPASGTYQLKGGISIRTFICPNGHHYTEHNDGG